MITPPLRIGPRLRIGVVGVGHFGRYHALKVAASPRATLVGIYDPDLERAKTVGWEAGAQEMGFEALLDASDALIVAAPAEAHYDLAAAALRAGKHVLVEKPIAATLAQADELGALAPERGRVLQVGHLERFSAAIRRCGGIGAPLYIEATRIAPFKPRGTDVSVILDLMIHDLDLVLALVDSEIESVDAVGAAGRQPARGHRQRAPAVPQRRGGDDHRQPDFAAHRATDADLRAEWLHGGGFRGAELTVIGPWDGAAARHSRCRASPGSGSRDVSWEDHDSLAAEHAAFVASVLDGAPVVVDAAAGRRALEAALQVMASMASSRARMAASGLLDAPTAE